MTIETTCTVTIKADHVGQFLRETDILTLCSLIRDIAIDQSKLDELREFMSSVGPPAFEVIDAFERLARTLEKLREST